MGIVGVVTGGLKAEGVCLHTSALVSTRNGALKTMWSHSPYAKGVRHVQPEPPRTFQTTARFRPALPNNTVGLDQVDRSPNGAGWRRSWSLEPD